MSPQKKKEPFVSPCGKESHSLEDAAKCHNLGERLLYDLLRGDLPGQKFGTKWDISCELIMEWKREHGEPNAAWLERGR